MNRLTQLEAKKMMKELEYLMSELDWKKEIVSEADTKFMGEVNHFLEKHPEIKDLFDKMVDERIKEAIKIAEIKSQTFFDDMPHVDNNEETILTKQTNPKLKKMYREIVKKTHPDKVSDERLNDLYIDASKYYENDDIFSMYTVFSKLGIAYDVDEDDIDNLKSRIEELREKINIVESSVTWVWHNGDQSNKEDLITRYVLSQIR